MYNDQAQPQDEVQDQDCNFHKRMRALKRRIAACQQEINNLKAAKKKATVRLSQIPQDVQQEMQSDASESDVDSEDMDTHCPADCAPGPSRDTRSDSIVEKIPQNEAISEIYANPGNSVAEHSEDNSMELNIEEAYEYLTGVFPNADPLYLRSSAEKFKNKDDARAFIEDKLESNDYPMREQDSAKIKVPEEQQRYTKNFNVEQFLTLFPNPFTHFEDETRKCKYSLIVLEFLKNTFRGVRISTIKTIYESSKFNMSIAAKNLRLTTDFITQLRCPREIRTDDIPMLQEMAFVRHQRAIRKHMKAVKQKEEEEFNSLKASGRLLTCQCCYDDECIPSKCSTCDDAHVFCNSCVLNGTNSKLGDGETHVPCFLNCGSEFSISTLKKVLPQTTFNILFKKRQAAEVMAANLEGLVSCPFCHFALIPPEGDKVFKCLNPECMKESCILCKEPNHVPLTCKEQKKNNKARKYVEEKMTQALTRTCYRCKRVFFKEEGCNHMTCLCGYQHFRGQGSDAIDKCPLWSDNQRLNAENVRKVEEDARRELLRQNPTIDIDTTGLAPALPPPTVGPHCDIPENDDADNAVIQQLNEMIFQLRVEFNLELTFNHI